MTISEACLLILEASVLPEFSGRIAMLDMGEPVRIVDLARDLLTLSGRPFEEGKTVVYTELRPGEKLHERLTDEDKRTISTEVEKVHLVLGSGRDEQQTGEVMDLIRYVDDCHEEMALLEMVRIFQSLPTSPPFSRTSHALEELEA